MSGAGTYDPFAIEKPVLRLGSHGEWTLGDITDGRAKRLAELQSQFEAMSETEDASLSDVAAIAGDFVEAACENSAGLKDLIVDLCDDHKHGDDAIGVRALTGMLAFVGDWLQGEATAGND